MSADSHFSESAPLNGQRQQDADYVNSDGGPMFFSRIGGLGQRVTIPPRSSASMNWSGDIRPRAYMPRISELRTPPVLIPVEAFLKNRPTAPCFFFLHGDTVYSLPVGALKLRVAVHVSTAIVKLRVVFVNTWKKNIDGMFALPCKGTVTSVEARVGPRRFLQTEVLDSEDVADIMRSKQQDVPINALRDRSSQSTIPMQNVHEYVPDLFRLPILGIAARETITIDVDLIEPLTCVRGLYSFDFQLRFGLGILPTNVPPEETVVDISGEVVSLAEGVSAYSTTHALAVTDRPYRKEFRSILTQLVPPVGAPGTPTASTAGPDSMRLSGNAAAGPAGRGQPGGDASDGGIAPVESGLGSLNNAFLDPAATGYQLDSFLESFNLTIEMPSSDVRGAVLRRVDLVDQAAVPNRLLFGSGDSSSEESKSDGGERGSYSAPAAGGPSAAAGLPGGVRAPTGRGSALVGAGAAAAAAGAAGAGDGETTVVTREHGTFVAFVAPPSQENIEKQFRRNIIFLIDRSGSMAGGPFKHALDGLEHALQSLTGQDRFNIMCFDHDRIALHREMIPVTVKNVELAVKWVGERRPAQGGTVLDLPLEWALQLLSTVKKGLNFVFLLTDGAVSNEREICRMAADRNRAGSARVLTFGIGTFCNWYFLRMLAAITRGNSTCVVYQENILEGISQLLAAAERPVLADVELEMQGVLSVQSYPFPIPDLFLGSPLTIAGRYIAHNTLPRQINLLGTTGGGQVRAYSLPVGEDATIPIEKVFLKQQLDLLVARAWLEDTVELKQEVIDLSVQSNIPTPYTTLIAYESGPEERARRDREDEEGKGNMKKPGGGYGGGAGAGAGAGQAGNSSADEKKSVEPKKRTLTSKQKKAAIIAGSIGVVLAVGTVLSVFGNVGATASNALGEASSTGFSSSAADGGCECGDCDCDACDACDAC